jgi:hypothetical protein
MTCPAVIRGAEQWNRWFNPNHSPLLISEGSEGRSRMPGGGIRLFPVLRYSVIVLALCLLLSDSFRLAFSGNTSRDASPRLQSAHSARTTHGPAHARIANPKRHSGV